MTKLTDKQRDALDKVVLTAIVDAPQHPRAADVARVPAVAKAIDALPRAKDAFRYLDNSLQRLRKQGRIEATRGDRWRVVHGRP
jgi:hypothetical protein